MISGRRKASPEIDYEIGDSGGHFFLPGNIEFCPGYSCQEIPCNQKTLMLQYVLVIIFLVSHVDGRPETKRRCENEQI